MITVICLGIFSLVVTSMFFRGADPVSPGRVFLAVWSLAIGMAEMKLSGFQGAWSIEGWMLLLIGIGAFMTGIGMAWVVNLETRLMPLARIREAVRSEPLDARLLARFIVGSVIMYFVSYGVCYAVKGFLPVFVVGTKTSRVDFYVFGFGVLINATAFITYFTLLYSLGVPGERRRKAGLITLATLALGSYFLLLQRYQIIMAVVISVVYLFYSRRRIRLRLVAFAGTVTVAFFYWISSLRLSNVVSAYLFHTSKMKIPREYAMLTEPYMYMVMNLENFARGFERLQSHTYGYFSFDWATALTGLKYPLQDYFVIDRTPYLNSGYNTYTTFWWFYQDFGIPGLVLLPLVWGFFAAAVYYRMRSNPSLTSVTAYAVAVFSMIISFFEYPFAHLWFMFNIFALWFILRRTAASGILSRAGRPGVS